MHPRVAQRQEAGDSKSLQCEFESHPADQTFSKVKFVGIRIHKAIGWGLTDQQMLEHNAFGCNDPDDMHEQLDQILSECKALSLPSAHIRDIVPDWDGFFTETNLLTKVPVSYTHLTLPTNREV